MKIMKVKSVLTLFTLFELTVDVFPAPASLVEANGQHSNGRFQASTDHGALS